MFAMVVNALPFAAMYDAKAHIQHTHTNLQILRTSSHLLLVQTRSHAANRIKAILIEWINRSAGNAHAYQRNNIKAANAVQRRWLRLQLINQPAKFLTDLWMPSPIITISNLPNEFDIKSHRFQN